MKYVSFLWPPLEAALSVPDVSRFMLKTVFEMALIKTNEIAISVDS
jgi:hypothetical protein